LARVLRKTAGDVIEVFDGQGQVVTAEIVKVSKTAVDLAVRDRHVVPKRSGEVILASAVPKGDRFRWLIEKAVELDVDVFLPLITQRSVVTPGTGKLDKMEQVVIEACKQSGRNHLMQIREPQVWGDFVTESLSRDPNSLAIFAHPGRPPIAEAVLDGKFQPLILIVGPEGGFTDEEVDQAVQSGVLPVGLGTNILRIETAAIALASSALMHRPQVPTDFDG